MDYSGLMDFRRCSWIFPSYWEWNNIPTDFKSIFQRGRVGIPPTSHGFDELIHTRTEESGETWKDELGGFHWRFSVISCSRSRFWGAGILYLTTGERDLEENRGRVCEEQGCLSSTVVFLVDTEKRSCWSNSSNWKPVKMGDFWLKGAWPSKTRTNYLEYRNVLIHSTIASEMELS